MKTRMMAVAMVLALAGCGGSGAPAGSADAASEDATAALSRALVAEGLGIVALVPETATLESLFFELTESEQATA